MVGPYADLSLYGKVDAEITREPWLLLYAGIEAGTGVRIEVLSHQIVDYYKPEVLGLRVKLWENSILPGGNITGTVKDALNGVPLANVKIDVYKDATLVSTGTSASNGNYDVAVSAGSSYKVIFSKEGYMSAEYQNIGVQVGQNTVLETVLQIDMNYSGRGNISGTIRNALDGSGVSGVVLNLRAGINVTSGNVISTTTTSNGGGYGFSNILAGNYTLEISRSGYNTSYFSVICLGGRTINNQDATITPILVPGETRIVLTWGLIPEDIDSHFTGPLPDGTRFHMYYDFKGYGSPWPNFVNLDLDDVTSYGPETTTLYQQLTGIYRFSVHDYTNKSSTSSFALSNSSAQVRVYKSTGLVATFNVPPNQEGTLWTVFEMAGSTITPINTMTYTSNPGEVTRPQHADMSLFKNLPAK